MIELIPSYSTLCLGIIALVTYYIYRSLCQYPDYWEKQGVPCFNPSYRGYVSMILKMLNHHEMEMYKRYGRIYGRYDGSIPVLTIGDPDILKKVLVKDANVFQNRRDLQFGDPVTDNNLSMLSGENWKRVRNILTPTFTSGKLRQMLPKVNACAEKIIESLNMSMVSGVPADLERLFGGYAMDVIASCAFGTKISSLEDSNNPFVVHAKKFFASGFSFRAVLSLLFPSVMKLFRISMLNPTSNKFFQNFVEQIVNKRKEKQEWTGGVDFLQLLMDVERSEHVPVNELELKDVNSVTGKESLTKPNSKFLTHDELAAQCVMFFLAGYDPTITLLQFTVYNLALYKDFQDKLYDEIEQTLSDKETIEYEDIMDMKYLDALICEALRLCTACIRMDRRAEEDYKIEESGIVIKKGQLISIPFYCIHRDPEWYPEPEKFDPTRFSAEARAARHPFVYLPFGLGPRSCIGNRFALMEAKLLLIKIIRTFRVTLSPETKVPLGFKEKQGALVVEKVTIMLHSRI